MKDWCPVVNLHLLAVLNSTYDITQARAHIKAMDISLNVFSKILNQKKPSELDSQNHILLKLENMYESRDVKGFNSNLISC